jgi:hypothetical protein
MIKLHSGNQRQLEEVFEALNKKFGNASSEIAKIKGMNISPTFVSFDYRELKKTGVYTTMWSNSKGQMLFFWSRKGIPYSRL